MQRGKGTPRHLTKAVMHIIYTVGLAELSCRPFALPRAMAAGTASHYKTGLRLETVPLTANNARKLW